MILQRRRLIAAGAVVALLLIAGFFLMRRSGGQTGARPGQAAVPVQVAVAKAGPIRSVLTYSGAIQASQQVNVAPRATGQIASIKVNVGSVVKAGDQLATLDPGSLAAQVLQASASLQSAQAKLALELAGARAEDVGAAQAQFDSAQANYQQLLNPTASDIAAADSALATADTAAKNAAVAVTTTRASLLGQVYIACNSLGVFGVPCNNLILPFPPPTVDAIAGTLQSGVGSINASNGAITVALLQANSAYATALANVSSAQQALAAAQAKRDAVSNPSPAAIAAQKTLLEQARANLANKQLPYTDADIQAARATVAQAQASLAIAQANLDQTVIVAPFDGVIGQKLLDVGATATAQTPVFTLAGKTVELHLSVDEARVGQIRTDQDVELAVPSYADKTFKGKVATVAPTGDARAHTFDVKVFAEDPGAQLKPGMFAQVNVVVAQKANAILVPNAAVVQQTRGAVVFAVANGKSSLRPVTVGVTDANNSEILTGVAAGDQIVVVGQNALRDGQAVQVSTPQTGGGAGGAAGGGASTGPSSSSPQPGQGSGPRGASSTGAPSGSPPGGPRPSASPTP